MNKRPTLDQVLAGADRATERVRRWPNWMLELSPSTAHLVKDEPMADQQEPKCVVCRELPIGLSGQSCDQCMRAVDYRSFPSTVVEYVWSHADEKIAALQARIAELEAAEEQDKSDFFHLRIECDRNVARIAELEAQLANTLEARAARTKQPWTGRELLEYAAKHADLFTREDFDCILEDVKGCTFAPELTVAVCEKCLHPACECP